MLRNLRSGPTLAASLIVLGGILFLDLFIMEASQSSQVEYLRHSNDERIVVVDAVHAREGDLVLVYTQTYTGRFPVTGADIYVVEHGEGEVFFRDQTPPHVYAHAVDADTVEWTDSPPLRVRRPPSPSGIDPERLDIVWIFHFQPSADLPDSAEGRKYFDAWMNSSVSPTTPVVIGGAAIWFHEVATVLIAILSALIVVSCILWFRQHGRRIAAPPRDLEAEAGVSIVEAGGTYLRSLRALLVGALLPIVYLCWVTLLFVWGESSGAPGPDPTWSFPIEAGTGLLLSVVMGSWILWTVRVHGAYRRWRSARNAAPTLD